MVEVKITEAVPEIKDTSPVGLYRTPDGFYYWYFADSWDNNNDCVWLTPNPSTKLQNGFKSGCRYRGSDVRVAGEVKLSFYPVNPLSCRMTPTFELVLGR